MVALNLIVAVSENGVIGRDGAMPWRLSTDLKRFKAITLGKPVIMGRKTWDSIGRALPGRLNIVITRDPSFAGAGAVTAHSFAQAKTIAEQNANELGVDGIFVIGGGEIFKQALPFANRMHITEILDTIEGDTFFPVFDPNEWHAVKSETVPESDKDSHATRYVIYER